MDELQLLTLDSILADLRAGSKKQVLQELAVKAAKISDLSERRIFDVLLERERLGSTGVGQGIAIPHGKLSEAKKTYGVFARLENPVEFDSIDGQPVDLIFMLIAPETSGADHLKALAKISRLMRDEDICDKLRGSEGTEAIYALLMGRTRSDAA